MLYLILALLHIGPRLSPRRPRLKAQPAYGMRGKKFVSRHLFKQMVSSGIMLNVIIMATVVSASTQCGLVDGGEREDGQFIWYKSNKMGHHSCMVNN